MVDFFCIGDFVARTDFLWKAKLKTEQEEVETMRGINKVKLFEFTPFLKKNRYYLLTNVHATVEVLAMGTHCCKSLAHRTKINIILFIIVGLYRRNIP